MSLIDKEKLLPNEDIVAYKAMLKSYGIPQADFEIHVAEDQDEIDMEDLDYVVMLYITISHKPTGIHKTYCVAQDSDVWIHEWSQDIKKDFYKKQ